MSVQFILGGSGCGKTYYMQHFITEEAKRFPDRQYIFLVPEQFTMQTQKELVAVSREKGIMNIDVQSFVRLAFRVLSETGANRIPVLDDMGKTMILKKVLVSIEDKLSYFGKNVRKNGYVQEIKSFLSELYQYNISETEMDEMIRSAGKRPVLARKLADMKVIYREFSAYLKDHYITSEEVMHVLANVTEDSAILRGSVVCVDGFTGFTPTQYEFLRRLLCVAKKVYVSVTIDERTSIVKTGSKHRLFYLSQKTLVKLRKLAEEERVEVCPEIRVGKKREETRFVHAEGLSFLEKELFRFPMKTYDKKPEDLSVHVAETPEKEIGFAIEKIRMLLDKNLCRYRDIAVVTGDLNTYGMLAKNEFFKADIPCFIDQKKGILEHPFVDLIDAVLEIFLSHFRMEQVMQFGKNLFSGLTKEQTDILDNFLRASGIRGYKKWQEVWDGSLLYGEMEPEEKASFALYLDMARIETLDQVGELYEKTGKGKHTVKEYVTALCEWMEQERYYFKIEEQSKKFEEQGEKELAFEYRQIYETVLGVFDDLVELLGEEKISLKEFKDILDTGFSEARIGLIPPGIDQVLVGDMNRSRLAHIKYLFFIGVNDGIIPQKAGEGGVISDAERQFLSEEEYELAPTVRESIYTEQFYLYLNLTKPSEHLFMTYHETGTDGSAKKPAYIIDRILRLFPLLEPVIEANRTDDSYLLGNFFGREYLIHGLRNKNFSEKKWQEVFKYYNEDACRNEKLSAWLHAAFYRENREKLSKEAVHALYHEVLSGSTSQFEQYAACAFSYFLRYGLHLQERKEHQVAFFDIGNIAHAALDRYTRAMIAEGKNWTDLDEKEQKKRVDQCVEAVVPNYKNGLLLQTERDSYVVSRLKRIVRRSVWAITKQMEKGRFKTVTSEFGFEILEKKKGQELLKEDDAGKDQLRLIGRVDRIDEMEEGEQVYLSVIDYKTGKKDLSLSDLYYGLQMQLLIYLKAGMEKRGEKTKKIVIPAGVLYYHVSDPVVEKKTGETKEETELRLLRELKLGGLLNEDDPVLPSFDRDFSCEDGGLSPSVNSDIFSMATTQGRTLKKTSKTITTEDFRILLDFTEKKLHEIETEIMDGNIEVNPYRDGTDTACTYCPYHGICRFDRRLPGNAYRELEHMSRDEVIRRISEEMHDSE